MAATIDVLVQGEGLLRSWTRSPDAPVGEDQRLFDAVTAVATPLYNANLSLAVLLVIVAIALIAKARWAPKVARIWSVAALVYVAGSTMVWVTVLWPRIDAVTESELQSGNRFARASGTGAKAAPFINVVFRGPFPVVMLVLLRKRKSKEPHAG